MSALPDWVVEAGVLCGRFRQILVSAEHQTLLLCEAKSVMATYSISTSRYGLGGTEGSYKTPLGKHRIAAKIGDGVPLGEVFVGRLAQGYSADILQDESRSEDDSITSRILWLEGLELGLNQGAGCDSKQRYIYIHGTAEEGLIGQPVSIGCVRMKNRDVIELFDRVCEGDLVTILK
ncbi:MAG: L,D-transpeptidase [Gammaproteobacteria bacterium]|nr:L,D-transpeptidase [Gammaproteobacteria bacterium]